jgi:GTP-binding protein
VIVRVESGEFIRSAYGEVDFLRDGRPEIAFVGRSNVGKSSLLNRLLGRSRLARVSRDPGRTRALNYFLVNSRFYFVDLPGYGYAKVGKQTRREWAQLMERYFASREPRVVQLVDAKVGATDLDIEAHRYLRALDCPSLVAATKVDRLPRSQRPAGMTAIRTALDLEGEDRLVPVSARTGEGIPELWREIEGFLVVPPGRHASKGVSS